jgi:hypothetical protein
MIGRPHRRCSAQRIGFLATICIVGLLITTLYISLSFVLNTDEYRKDYHIVPDIKVKIIILNHL